MLNGVGLVIILACVFGSFLMSGGKMEIIFHALPHEMMAIAGAAIGAFIVSNPLGVVKKAGGGLLRSFKGSRWKAQDYKDLLTLLFGLLVTFKKGATAIEPHLDKPEESPLFNRFPRLLKDHHLIDFICDYLRMMTVNFEDPHQLAEAMENDIEAHHHHELGPQHALQAMADGLPAIGIVAAVLGVIKTMGSIDQPVEVLGAMIGGALVGTFLGVLLAYCLVGPLASKLLQVIEADGKTFVIAKTAIVAHAQGMPTQVAIEIARRTTQPEHAPTFQQLETALDEAKMTLTLNQPDPGLVVDTIRLPAHGTTVTAEDLKVRLVLAVDFGERVQVDASGVESVGQAVLQLLIAARNDAQAAGRPFAIVNPSPSFSARVAALGLNHTLAIPAVEDVEP